MRRGPEGAPRVQQKPPDSQVDGGTASTIECVDSASPSNTVSSGSTGANGDGSATANNLRPDTYTCTVFIDP